MEAPRALRIFGRWFGFGFGIVGPQELCIREGVSFRTGPEFNPNSQSLESEKKNATPEEATATLLCQVLHS